MPPSSLRLALTVAYTFYIALAAAVSSQEPLKLIERSYVAGDAIPVSCLNRTMYVEHF